jgi:DNA-binding transcriptional LysR family regulator
MNLTPRQSAAGHRSKLESQKRGDGMISIDQLDIRDLQCMVMVAETLNFTVAAKRLYMTQPGVTARVSKVEKNLEYKLFDRSKGVVKAITPEGFILVEEAKRMLEDLHHQSSGPMRLTGRFQNGSQSAGHIMSIYRYSPSWLQQTRSRACTSHSCLHAARTKRLSQCC